MHNINLCTLTNNTKIHITRSCIKTGENVYDLTFLYIVTTIIMMFNENRIDGNFVRIMYTL